MRSGYAGVLSLVVACGGAPSRSAPSRSTNTQPDVAAARAPSADVSTTATGIRHADERGDDGFVDPDTLPSGARRRLGSLKYGVNATSVAVTPEGRALAFDDDHEALVEVRDDGFIRPTPFPYAPAVLAVDAAGRLLVGAPQGIWAGDVQQAKRITETSCATPAAASPSGARIACTGDGRTSLVVAGPDGARTLGVRSEVGAVAVTDDGLVALRRGARCELFDARGVLVTGLDCEEHALLAARPGGGFLLVERETLTTIDREGRSRGRVPLPPDLASVAATASPSGRWLGIVGHEKGVVVDLAEGRAGAPFPVVYGARALAFARDEGSVVVQGVAQQGLRVPSGERVWGATGPNENVWALAIGPSRIFALHDTDIAVYDAAGALSARISAPPPTRKAVLAALSDDVVRLGAYGAWTVLDVASGRTLCETKIGGRCPGLRMPPERDERRGVSKTLRALRATSDAYGYWTLPAGAAGLAVPHALEVMREGRAVDVLTLREKDNPRVFRLLVVDKATSAPRKTWTLPPGVHLDTVELSSDDRAVVIAQRQSVLVYEP
ncbi:hypothetical protein [Polyangium mundeleinium]|uniref:Lipoprotein n=1 Tax=Polyangium mundeleinium TaxID=2995306 RepID=A0ABT5EW32_9BACT|nr:hypothetical protein [Polyangium mundeleinium]MDC0745015.1 hypothetical protein [Polyangium mundeleinium]